MFTHLSLLYKIFEQHPVVCTDTRDIKKGSLFFALKGGLKDAFYILKGIGWNISNIGLLLKKRHFINLNIRKVSDRNILNRIKKIVKIEYQIRLY